MIPRRYRTAALQCILILTGIGVFVSRSRNTRLAWTIVSIALGPDSAAGLTEAQIGRQLGVSELCLRRTADKFMRLANLDPAGGFRALGQVRSNGSDLKENGSAS
jgi:hypothetical protein